MKAKTCTSKLHVDCVIKSFPEAYGAKAIFVTAEQFDGLKKKCRASKHNNDCCFSAGPQQWGGEMDYFCTILKAGQREDALITKK